MWDNQDAGNSAIGLPQPRLVQVDWYGAASEVLIPVPSVAIRFPRLARQLETSD